MVKEQQRGQRDWDKFSKKEKKKRDRITELMEQCWWGQTSVMILDLIEYKKESSLEASKHEKGLSNTSKALSQLLCNSR